MLTAWMTSLFPDLEYDRLEVAALFTIWLFLWDDVVDGGGGKEGEQGELDEVKKAERLRDGSVGFVKRCLLGSPEQEEGVGAELPNASFELFKEVARWVRVACGEESEGRRRFFASIKGYMEACVEEAKWRVSGNLPSLDEFYGFRLRTAGVEMLLDLSEMLNDVRLPEVVLESREVRDMRLSANKIGIM